MILMVVPAMHSGMCSHHEVEARLVDPLHHPEPFTRHCEAFAAPKKCCKALHTLIELIALKAIL